MSFSPLLRVPNSLSVGCHSFQGFVKGPTALELDYEVAFYAAWMLSRLMPLPSPEHTALLKLG
jgi:hypothetical protein